MAVPALFFLLVYGCIYFLLSPCLMAETKVEVTTPVNPVTLGGILAIRCQIWGVEREHVVKIFRTLSTRTEEITSGDTYMRSSINQRVFLAIRNLSDGSVAYFITVTNITHEDQGDYACKIFSISDFNYINIAGDSIQINVVSLPNEAYPVCASFPMDPISLMENSTLKLTCSSESGVPAVDLKWRRDNHNYYHDYVASNITDGDIIHSELTLNLDISFNGSIFYCDVTSNAFDDWIRTCQIGPVAIKSNPVRKSDIPVTQGSVFKVNTIQRSSINCERKCQRHNERLRFNLTLATVAASILSIIFLAITIFMCYKYHKVSGIATMDHHDDDLEINYDENSEPVYVTLKRCSTGETSYMTMDDPTNPENKVLLPKDVFDAYYKTLSLKREKHF
ncbi:uncharacterized protein [Amphiura filiformis]|uniref:uncharacterized protein n=1 Tax=Amphiura filiformis TaxID=82378 RepID=UPI003B218CF4